MHNVLSPVVLCERIVGVDDFAKKVMNKESNMDFNKEINLLKTRSLYRHRKVVEETECFPEILINGQRKISFASNNYLNLGDVIRSSLDLSLTKSIIQQSSPLITGYTASHAKLEEALAALKGQEATILFSNGFVANLALLTTIVGPKDLVVLDKLNHASIMEVTKYKDINFRIFPHKNYSYLGKILREQKAKFENIFIVSDTLFSMEGDTPDFKKLRALAQEHKAYLILDDAHATGVYGIKGAGLATKGCLKDYNKLIVTGSLSKALQSYGGFVCASRDIVEYLVNKAKPYIYNTALPQIHVESCLLALEHIEQAQVRLWKNIVYFVTSMKSVCKASYSPIIPIYMESNEHVLAASEKLSVEGVFVPAIRYPTVPKNTALLRISLSAGHTKAQLDKLVYLLSAHQIGLNHS